LPIPLREPLQHHRQVGTSPRRRQNIVERTQSPDQIELLEDETHLAACRRNWRVSRYERRAHRETPAAVGLCKTRQASEQCRLAGATGAKDGDDLAPATSNDTLSSASDRRTACVSRQWGSPVTCWGCRTHTSFRKTHPRPCGQFWMIRRFTSAQFVPANAGSHLTPAGGSRIRTLSPARDRPWFRGCALAPLRLFSLSHRHPLLCDREPGV